MLNVGAVSRAASTMTVEPQEAQRLREDMLEADGLSEIEQQFQLPIHGRASSKLRFVERALTFDVHFYNATEQRNIPYTEPGFYYGAVIDSKVPILVTAVVRSWIKREDEAVTGCVLAMGVLAPGSGAVNFTGNLHIFFQGFGAPAESEGDMEAPSETGGIDLDAPDPGDPGDDE